MFIIPFLFISIFAIILSLVFNKSFANVLPASIFTIIVLLYLFGCIDNLLFGIYVVFVIVSIFIIILFYWLVCKKHEKLIEVKNIIISPGFFIFLLLFILIYLYNLNASFSFWDEWTHWGPYVKDMFIREKFYNTYGHIATVHLSYPPFKQIFEYFYCKITNEYSMQNMYRANQLLCFSIGIMVFANVKFESNNIGKNIKIILSMILSILYFILVNRIIDFQANPIKSIYGDAFLGLSFGFFLVNILQFEFGDRFKFYNLILSGIALVLSKQMGIILFLMFYFVFFISVIFNHDLNKVNFIKGFLIFIIVILFFVSWKIIVICNNVTDQFDINTHLSITGLFSILFLGGGLDWQRDIITNFINWLLYKHQIGLTIIEWYILLSILFVIVSYVVKKNYEKKILLISI